MQDFHFLQGGQWRREDIKGKSLGQNNPPDMSTSLDSNHCMKRKKQTNRKTEKQTNKNKQTNKQTNKNMAKSFFAVNGLQTACILFLEQFKTIIFQMNARDALILLQLFYPSYKVLPIGSPRHFGNGFVEKAELLS